MIGDLLPSLRQSLEPFSETASLDAQVLLAHILEKPRAWVLAHPEAVLSSNQVSALDLALERLLNGEPLPYVLGEWEFFGLTFTVSPAVLIPRPETEGLVETALQWMKARPHLLSSSLKNCLIADVGTGSGCIAIALAFHLPNIHILATDISTAALEIACANALRQKVASRIHLLQTDLLSSFPKQPLFHLVCANLPYIPQEVLPGLPVYRREPALALDGGPHGLKIIERLLIDARPRLAPGGLLLLEIETSQGQAVSSLAQDIYPSATVHLLRDLADRDRLVSIQLYEK